MGNTGLDLESIARDSDVNPAPVMFVRNDGELLYANRGSWLLLQQWNVAVGDLLPQPWVTVVATAFEAGHTEERTFTAGHVSIHLLFVPIAVTGNVCVFGADVTRAYHTEKDQLIRAHVYSGAHEAILVMDEEFRTIDVNPAYTRLTGYTDAEVLGEMPSFIDSAKRDNEQFTAIMESARDEGNWHGEIWDRSKTGEQIALRVSLTSVQLPRGSATHYVALISDITHHKAAEEQLYRMAHHDGLTGLPNRYLFADHLHNAISHARRTNESFAVMMLDLDGFKRINDTFGHRAGDHLLQSIGKQLGRAVRDSDMVARFGGDEFAVLARDISKPEDATVVAQKILSAVSQSTEVEGYEVFVTASVGIALFPFDQTEIEPLLRQADMAMYKIKRSGKNDFQFYSDEAHSDAMRQLQIQSSLRTAIERKSIKVVYQPQINIDTGAVVGVEALARWSDPVLGDVPPEEFIPIAEDFGLIHELGEEMLRRACAQGREWEREMGATLRIGVNVSARQIRKQGFPDMVRRTLSETGLPAGRLELELTETVFIADTTELQAILENLASMGISLSVDDFGTRYASLMYIKSFPINRIKIDRSFVRDLPDDSSVSQIVTAIVAMAKSLGCDVVAEGVETQEQIDFLRSKGCREIQGFLGSPPVEPERLPQMLRDGLPNWHR